MADLNKVFLIGRLTHDPELRYTPNGTPVADIKLATSRKYATREGETREETLYIVVTVWNRQAENCCQYLRKGRAVHVEGYLKVEAERVQFLEKKDDSIPNVSQPMDDGGYSSPPSAGSSSSYAPRRPSVPAPSDRPSLPPRRPSPSIETSPPDGGDEDDIPF